jgi:two-component system, cell cycle response regulator DivK
MRRGASGRVAGETILIVEDSAVSLKLTAALLRTEGYRVHIASTAEQALSTLRTLRPHLMLVDLQLPGMSGLELTRRVKQDENLHKMIVVALTGHAPEGEEHIAKAAGCDGFLVKSSDTHGLIMRVRSYLDRDAATPPAPAAEAAAPKGSSPPFTCFALPASEMEDLRRSFLADGAVQIRRMLASLESQIDAPALSRMVHPWTGTAGMLGFSGISELSREVEAMLETPSLSAPGLRAALTNLAHAFADPGVAPMDAALPDFIIDELTGKRVALVGFGEVEADRMCAALERVGAKPRLLEASDPPDSPLIRECNAIMMHVRRETLASAWLDTGLLTPPLVPLVLIGGRDLLLSLDPSVQSRAREFLIDGWQPEEALMRLSFALSRTTFVKAPTPAQGTSERTISVTEIVIADDDITVRTLVRAALENEGMRCRLASNGPEALDLIHNRLPQAAVLDVNMPGMDGFELLAAIRAEGLPVRVILLTARQHQNDVVRGFSLGADDYLIKPVRPMELVARLKRLIV